MCLTVLVYGHPPHCNNIESHAGIGESSSFPRENVPEVEMETPPAAAAAAAAAEAADADSGACSDEDKLVRQDSGHDAKRGMARATPVVCKVSMRGQQTGRIMSN